MIDSCPEDYPDLIIKEKCENTIFYIRGEWKNEELSVEKKFYKNVLCLYCNMNTSNIKQIQRIDPAPIHENFMQESYSRGKKYYMHFSREIIIIRTLQIDYNQVWNTMECLIFQNILSELSGNKTNGNATKYSLHPTLEITTKVAEDEIGVHAHGFFRIQCRIVHCSYIVFNNKCYYKETISLLLSPLDDVHDLGQDDLDNLLQVWKQLTTNR